MRSLVRDQTEGLRAALRGMSTAGVKACWQPNAKNMGDGSKR